MFKTVCTRSPEDDDSSLESLSGCRPFLSCLGCDFYRGITDSILLKLLRELDHSPSPAFLNKGGPIVVCRHKNGAAESGLITPRTYPKSKKWKTMQQLREESLPTRKLPSPLKAIRISNSLAKNKGNLRTQLKKSSLDYSVAVVNIQLRIRLVSGQVLGHYDYPDAWGEALLSHSQSGGDAGTPKRMSHLIHHSERAYVKKRTSLSDRVSFSKNAISAKQIKRLSPALLENPNMNLDHLSLKDFIDILLNMSLQARRELVVDKRKTKKVIKGLVGFVKSPDHERHKSEQIHTGLSDRWMVAVYTMKNIEIADELTIFRCLLVRLLLQSYNIAYIELDVTAPTVLKELATRLTFSDPSELRLPQLSIQEICIGGCQVLYHIYVSGYMRNIFESYIMDPGMYKEWLETRHRLADQQLSVDVNLKPFLSLMVMSKSSTDHLLDAADLKKIKAGKKVVKWAREKWFLLSKTPFQQPSLYRFILLRCTIILAFKTMNRIYTKYVVHLGQDEKEQAKKSLRKQERSWLPWFGKSRRRKQPMV